MKNILKKLRVGYHFTWLFFIDLLRYIDDHRDNHENIINSMKHKSEQLETGHWEIMKKLEDEIERMVMRI